MKILKLHFNKIYIRGPLINIKNEYIQFIIFEKMSFCLLLFFGKDIQYQTTFVHPFRQKIANHDSIQILLKWCGINEFHF